MTRDEILALSDRDLDRAVAEARGEKLKDGFWKTHDGTSPDTRPVFYSHDIAAAMQMLGEIDQQFDIRWCPTMLDESRRGQVSCRYLRVEFPTLTDLPAAICKVYLMLKETK